MAATRILSSSYLSNLDKTPFSHADVTVAETRDVKNPLSSVTVTEVDNDTLPLETAPQNTTPAVKERSRTKSTVINFATEVEHFRLSFEILNVLEKYGRHIDLKAPSSKPTVGTASESSAWIGKLKFLTHVYYYVQQSQPIQLTLPAFPCKSVCLNSSC